MSIPFHSPQQPTAIVMVGGPGSGKSSSQKKTIELIGTEYRDYVIVDPDRVLTALFESDNTCYARVQPVLEALINAAIEKRKHIVLDTTGRDFQRSCQFAERFLKAGYKIVVCITQINPDIALARAVQRQAAEGRGVDEAYLRAAYAAIERIVPQYVESRLFNEVFVFNNSGHAPVCELSFDRAAACRLSPSLCGQLNPRMPDQQASVYLYDHNGPVDPITVPYELALPRLTFKYSWVGLPDWTLTLNGTHAAQADDPDCAHPYSIGRGLAGRVVLSVRIAEAAARCVPSLPQAGSRYWQTSPPGRPLVLDYTMEGWAGPVDACPAGQCA